jgi:VIT1/CCC1 family predicted Fe2+/Mn2+ transporter
MPVAQKAVVVATSPRDSIVRHLALFTAAALFVFVLSLTYGLDLSPGFF